MRIAADILRSVPKVVKDVLRSAPNAAIIVAMAATPGFRGRMAVVPDGGGSVVPIGCEASGGYKNPKNPDEWTPGRYPAVWDECPMGSLCDVSVPAVGVCVDSNGNVVTRAKK